MNLPLPMNIVGNTDPARPVRYVAISGASAKSCRKLKSLLKLTRYYCLADCHKNVNEMLGKDIFYIPDCVILDIRSLHSLFSVSKRAQKIRETFPGIKLVLYYNMLRRYPLLEQRNRQFPEVHAHDDEQKQVYGLERVLQDNF